MKGRNSKGQFLKGHIPYNKGLKGIHNSPETEFKKGQTAGANNYNWKGGVQKPASDVVLLYAGVGERLCRPRVIYEQHFGKIPTDYIVIHKDGDRYNDNPNNLEAISRAENLKRNLNKKQLKATKIVK